MSYGLNPARVFKVDIFIIRGPYKNIYAHEIYVREVITIEYRVARESKHWLRETPYQSVYNSNRATYF